MDALIDFFSLREPNVRVVLLGTLLFSSSSAAIGCFTLLRKRSLIGDAIAHSVLPGLCLAFMLFNTKNLLVLIGGAAVTGWLSIYAIDYITAHSKIKADAAIGIVLSVFFGTGILLLTSIQNSGNASQSGLDSFLFGSAASILREDVMGFALVSVILFGGLAIFYKEFKLISFDRDYAVSIGLPVRRLETVLATLTVLAICVGIQAVGVVLMAALLITPAAAARFLTNRLSVMIALAATFSMVSGVAGTFISYTSPQMPTGPWIVLSATAIAIFAMLFAPENGTISHWLQQRKNRKKILLENILKLFFHLGEQDEQPMKSRFKQELLARREIDKKDLNRGLTALTKDGLLDQRKNMWSLTDEGFKQAARIARIHRLWELYLTKYLRIAEDHVHEDAEAIEHVITPELEAKLEELLDFPTTDPHGKHISRKSKKTES